MEEEVHIPHDVICNHILPRVPNKSVGRFRCVSKQWHSFLTSDMFENRLIDHHQTNIKLLVLSESETSFKFTTIDCEAPPSDKGLTPTRRPLPPFKGILPRRVYILASFHGLVCLGISTSKHTDYINDLILWNPLTNEYKRLSKSNSHKECNSFWYTSWIVFGLYYNSSEDDYKLLYVIGLSNYVYIYSLKSDLWRKVVAFQSAHIGYHGHWTRGTYLNENLYFLAQNPNGQLSSIIRFDTKTERISNIETPNVYANNLYAHDYFATIMVKSDCIHVCVKYNTYGRSDSGSVRTTCCIELWKLDKYENLEELVNYQLNPDDDIIPYLRPLHLTKNNGNWLMICYYGSKHHFYKVDLRKTGIKNKSNSYDEYELYAGIRMDSWPQQARYTETFVSPNKYTK